MVTTSDSVNSIVLVILASVVALLLASNVIIFIIGCVCGHCISQKRTTIDNQPAPVYENCQLKSTRAEEQELELEMNEAYGHFRSGNVML